LVELSLIWTCFSLLETMNLSIAGSGLWSFTNFLCVYLCYWFKGLWYDEVLRNIWNVCFDCMFWCLKFSEVFFVAKSSNGWDHSLIRLHFNLFFLLEMMNLLITGSCYWNFRIFLLKKYLIGLIGIEFCWFLECSASCCWNFRIFLLKKYLIVLMVIEFCWFCECSV